jgi:hypothetical protein
MGRTRSASIVMPEPSFETVAAGDDRPEADFWSLFFERFVAAGTSETEARSCLTGRI